MPLFDRFRPRPSLVEVSDTAAASPWSDRSTLARVVLSDLAGVKSPAWTRRDAQRVPALARARAVICGTLSRQPLASFTDELRDEEQPAWLSNTTTTQTPRARMLWTLDDVFHYGTSLWVRQNDADGLLVDAIRAERDDWHLDPDGRVVIRDGNRFRQALAHEVILFEGPQEGIVTLAADGIAASHDMRRAWSKRVETPVPLVELHSTDQNMILDDDEIKALLTEWEAARRAGGAAFTPYGIEVNVLGGANIATDLYVAGRNAERLDFANWVNLSASVLDGSLSTASLTYTTQEGDRSELVDISLAYWANPLEARLSLDDVSPAGHRIAFDLQYMTLPARTNHPSGPTFED